MTARVLHVTATFPRSVDDVAVPFLLDLLEAERSAGMDASCIALHDDGLPNEHVVGSVPVRRVRYAPRRAERLAYRGGLVHGLRSAPGIALLGTSVSAVTAATVRVVRRDRPDVVHGHWLAPGGLAAVVAAASVRSSRARPRAVVTMHGSDVELAARQRTFGRLARAVAARADALLAVSEPLARRAEDVLWRPPGSIGVGRLPIASGLEPADPPTGAPRLLAAGRASSEKGFDVLLDALARPEASGWVATIATEGPERDGLEERARLLRVSDRVMFSPLLPRAEFHAIVRSHHLVVVPSRAEGLGLIALEALALGRPVIASAVGGLAEVIDDSTDGLLVPPADVDALAKALATITLTRPAARAVERHRPDTVAAAHAAAYGLA